MTHFTRTRKTLVTSWLPGKALILIVLVGFLLRFATLLWGIPTPVNKYIFCPNFSNSCYHADEAEAYIEIIKFPENYFSSERFLGYGATMPLIIGTFISPLKAITALGYLNSYFYNLYIVIISRFFSIIMSVGAIFLSYLLAKKLFYEKKIALASALVTSLSVSHIAESAIAKPTSTMSFFLILNFFFSYWAVIKSKTVHYVLLGLLTALLLGTKMDGVIFLFVPLLLSLTNHKFKSRLIVVYVSSVVFFFFLLHPYILKDPLKYYLYFLQEKSDWIDRSANLYSIKELLGTWSKQTDSAFGFQATLMFLLGILLAIKKGIKSTKNKLVPALFIVSFYFFWRWHLETKYSSIVVPLISIYIGNFLGTFFLQGRKYLKLIGVSLTIYIICCTAKISLPRIYTHYYDPRTAASRYIMQSIPQRTTIGFSAVTLKYGWQEHSWRYPKFDLNKYNIINFLSQPDILVVSLIDLKEIELGLQSDSLLAGFTWDKNNNRYWYRYLPPEPEVFKFYKDLLYNQDNEYHLLQEFQNVTKVHFLPEVRIYKRLQYCAI